MARHDVDSAPLTRAERPKTKKPYVRIMTGKRREQNRRAQKVYREKQRQRLEGPEDKVSVAGPQPRSGVLTSNEDVSHLKVAPKTESGRTTPRSTEPIIIDFNEIFTANGDISVPGQGGLVNLLPTAPSPPAFTATLPQHNKPPSTNINPTSKPNYLDDYWPMPPIDPSEPYIPPPNSHPPAYEPYHGGSLTTISRPYAYHRQLRLFAAAATRLTTSSTLPSPVPSPYTNHLTLTCEQTLAASLSIALSLGITHTQYLDDHPSPFPTRPSSSSSSSTFTTSTSIVPTLRPRPSQSRYPHPSYLDCIVFPTLRDRAVKASADGVLDHVEFFLDLMHGGLVCWGGSTPVPSRNTRGGRFGGGEMRIGTAAAGGGEGVPWSVRSWEARRWFLEKWEWLVGREEEERVGGEGVWEVSRSWWRVRGEEWAGEVVGGGSVVGEVGDLTPRGCVDMCEGLAWAQGLRQESWEGARLHEDILEDLKRNYVPMGARAPADGS